MNPNPFQSDYNQNDAINNYMGHLFYPSNNVYEQKNFNYNNQ